MTIKLGGKECEYVILYRDVSVFLKRWNLIYGLAKKQFSKTHGREFNPAADSLPIPNLFYFWVVWKCLKKKGWWPFKRPFRSMRAMINNIERDEFDEIVAFAGREIFKFIGNEEGRQPGNVKQ